MGQLAGALGKNKVLRANEEVTAIDRNTASALVDRSGGKHNLPFPFIPLLKLAIATYTADNLPEALAAIPVTKPGSRWLKKTA